MGELQFENDSGRLMLVIDSVHGYAAYRGGGHRGKGKLRKTIMNAVLNTLRILCLREIHMDLEV